MHSLRFPQSWLLVTALFMFSGVAIAQPETTFEKTTSVAGTPLTLNGSGTRYKLIFKVYDMGLYLPTQVKTADAAIAAEGPKKLSFVALRKVSGTDLGRAFITGLDDNNPREATLKHLASTTQLIAIFSGKNYMLPGEAFSMEFVPGKGTTFYIKGQAQGKAMGDGEFFQMVMRIWLGSSPADWRLKEALLSPA